MQLNKVQQQFKELMLNHPDALDNPPEEFAAYFETGRIPLPERLKVYRNNIVGSLTDVMLASFPLCEKLVGKDFLEGMARSFILKNPPDAGCLNTFGRGFAEFIETFEPAKSLPYLPDVARLETALLDAYYAKDDAPLTPQQLQSIPQVELDHVKLTLRHSRFLLKSNYPLIELREFCLSGENPPELDSGGAHLLIDRPFLDSEIVELDEASFNFLTEIEAGKTLGKALEFAINKSQNFDFNKFLQFHLKRETFSTLNTNT